jgi:hypothetical protein
MLKLIRARGSAGSKINRKEESKKIIGGRSMIFAGGIGFDASDKLDLVVVVVKMDFWYIFVSFLRKR